MLIQTEYDHVRHMIRVGDGICMGGHGFVSWAIRRWTCSPLSHWATVFEAHEPERRVRLIESTSLNDVKGVQYSYASDRIRDYDGRVWWLPLSAESRRRIKEDEFTAFLAAQIGKGYDYADIAHLCLDVLHLIEAREDWRAYICSELGAAGGKIGGILPPWMDTSEVTPIDLARLKIWAPDYYQLHGTFCEIPRYNSLSPEYWRN
jgi:hypothetical protein